MTKPRIPVIAAVTIGQSPRDDVVPEMRALVPGARWIEAGALDGLDGTAIAGLGPQGQEFPLVTRLRTGGTAVVGENAILPLLQAAVDRISAEADLIILICSDPIELESRAPIVFSGHLLAATVSCLHRGRPVAVLTPGEAQIDRQRERWGRQGVDARVFYASPYKGADFAELGRRARAAGASLVVLDCFGYSTAMKLAVAAASGLPTLLVRSLVARLAGELVSAAP